ncbi:hypothetical protein APED_27245 [Acanthopleuribacter pedis]
MSLNVLISRPVAVNTSAHRGRVAGGRLGSVKVNNFREKALTWGRDTMKIGDLVKTGRMLCGRESGESIVNTCQRSD